MWQILFPSRSLTGEGEEWLTKAEWRELEGVPSIMDTARLRAYGCADLDMLWAGDRYGRSPLLRRMIHLFKYKRIAAYREALVSILHRPFEAYCLPHDAVLCPVPLHWTRRFLRGFNQSEMLAADLGRQRSMTVMPLLRRVRRTGWQSHRHDWQERVDAMRDAFAVPIGVGPLPMSIVLVDDIFTSGATLDACAHALKQVGVQWVGALVVARR